MEPVRIADLTVTSNIEKTKLFVQWHLLPPAIEEHFNDEYRRTYFKRHHINGFKISSNFPTYKLSELIDILQRNYTLEYIQQGEICLYLLRRRNYEKFCKQSPYISTQTLKSSLIVESDRQQSSSSSWYSNEPMKSILIGSMLGILFVLIILTLIILMISRCPYLLCHSSSSKYQNNDSKSESLLVRPTPTNTISWPIQSQQHFHPRYHHHHQLRPASYQASLSTQCTCPTHSHSSGSSSTGVDSICTHAQNYHIYQEILNDDSNATNTMTNCRTCHPLKIDTNTQPTSLSTNATMNSEQCELCSLSVLV